MPPGPGKPFEKGHKLAKGGRRNPPGGRPTKEQQEIHKAAKEIAQEYIETHIKPLMETYIGLAAGKVVTRRTPKGEKKFKLSVDPSTTRDAVGKLLPDAKQVIDLNISSPEDFYRDIQESKKR
jgi:hypothetical protein